MEAICFIVWQLARTLFYTVVALGSEFLRLDKFGTLLSQSFRGAPVQSSFFAYDVISTVDSCFVVSGWNMGLNQMYNSCIAKTKPNGELLWLKYTNVSGLYLINTFYTIELIDGSLVSYTGARDSTTNSHYTFFQKTDSSGSLLWSKIVEERCKLIRFKPTNDNGFVGIGTIDQKTLLVKFDSSGSVVWSKSVFDSTIIAVNIFPLRNGNFIIEGRNNTSQSNSQFYLGKFDSFGNLLWYKQYDKLIWNGVGSITERSDGDLLFIGSLADEFGGFLMDADPAGIPKYSRGYVVDPVNPIASFYSVFESNDRSLTFFGLGNCPSGWASGFLIKVDSLGNGLQYNY